MKEMIPFGIIQVRSDNGGLAVIALIHEFEKSIGLFGFEGQVAQFINDQQIISGKAFKQLG